MDDYVKPAVAAKYFGVSKEQLRQWQRQGAIQCIWTRPPYGGHRRYNLRSLNRGNNQFVCQEETELYKKPNSTKESFCYCRVSSTKQRDDLSRQEEYLKSLYPEHTIIKDIGSGLNFKRRGLLMLLEAAARGCVKEIVVAHRDRLCRFGFDLLEWMFSYYGVKIIILSADSLSPDEELSRDLLSIIHVFSCRANGKRRYQKKKEAEKTGKEDQTGSESE